MNPTMKLLMLTREPEERFRDRRGREHYDNGRYAPVSELDAHHYPPPVYEERERGGMNQIGFALDNNREIGGDYRSDAAYSRTDELEHRSPRMARGKPAAAATDTLTREMAEEWMNNLQNEDGTKGPHWTLEQVKQVMAQKGVECDPIRLWVAMNAEYSDRSAVNRKHNVNTIDFYLDSAIASWLKDKDAVGDKEAAYYMYVVRH